MPAIGQALAIPFSAGPGGGVPSSLLAGIVEWWGLNELSGNRVGSVAGTIFSPVGAITTTVGAGGSVAARLNGTAEDPQYFTTPSQPKFVFGDNTFTLCGWINVKSNTSSGVLEKWAGSGNEFILYYESSGSLIYWFIVSPTDGTKFASFPYPDSDFNSWLFVIADYDKDTSKMRLFFNAVLVAETDISGGVIAGTDPLRAGLPGNGSNDCALQRLGVWSRTLTADERVVLFNSGNGLDYPFS